MPANVIVLGGGFAGISAVKRLARCRDVNVHLVDRGPCSVFSPLLPDLISGRIRPGHVQFALEPFCRKLGARFTRAEVREISADPPTVVTDQGEMTADFLVLCLGCETNFFGIDSAARRAIGLKTVSEGAAIRDRAIRAADQASATGRPATLLVVGGGYTGLESASHLASLLRAHTGLGYNRLGEVARIIICEKQPQILQPVSQQARTWARGIMDAYGIEVRTGAGVTDMPDDRTAVLSDGSTFEDATVVWAAGVKAAPAACTLTDRRGRNDRLIVDDYLRVAGVENVFAAGDVAAARKPGEDNPLRMGVQFSLVGGASAAGNVLRAVRGQPLRPFDPLDPGYVVPLAVGCGVGNILGCELRGRTPFLLHYLMCVLRSWGWPNRLGIVGDLLGRR